MFTKKYQDEFKLKRTPKFEQNFQTRNKIRNVASSKIKMKPEEKKSNDFLDNDIINL